MAIKLTNKKKRSVDFEICDDIKLLFQEQKSITIKEEKYRSYIIEGLKGIALKHFKKLFNKIQDFTVKDISTLSESQALAYLDRIDLSKIKTIKILRTSVNHKNSPVVLKGISILKEIRTIDARKAINTTLNNKDEEVVLSAIEALKLFKNQNIVKPLANCLTRKNKKIALASLWALAEIKSPEAIEMIETVLNSNDNDLKQTAIWILKGLKNYKTKTKVSA